MSCLRFSKRLFFSCQLGRRKSEVTKVYGAERVSLLIPMYLKLLRISQVDSDRAFEKDKEKLADNVRFSSCDSMDVGSRK